MQKIAIELTKDDWEDIAEVIYEYADSIWERYEGYLGKGQAMEREGRIANRMAEISDLIEKEIAKHEEQTA